MIGKNITLNVYYFKESNITLRIKLFFLSLGTLTLNLYTYLSLSVYKILKFLTLYEFRKPTNTWSDAFIMSGTDLTRIASGPIILPALQITAMLGTITPYTDGPKDARKMYALGETLLYRYNEYTVALCFKQYKHKVDEVLNENKNAPCIQYIGL